MICQWMAEEKLLYSLERLRKFCKLFEGMDYIGSPLYSQSLGLCITIHIQQVNKCSVSTFNLGDNKRKSPLLERLKKNLLSFKQKLRSFSKQA